MIQGTNIMSVVLVVTMLALDVVVALATETTALALEPRSISSPSSNNTESLGCGDATPGISAAFNCSYNGHCINNKCVCRTGWVGKWCHQLDLLPASNRSGLNQLRGPPYTSTWGGSVVYDPKSKLYHMYAAEISKHCGIYRWVSNSIVVHATSAGASDGWCFARQGVVSDLFSHEPIVARAPTGEFVVYMTAYPGDASDCPVCNCKDGTSASGGSNCSHECGGGKNKTLFSYFTSSTDPAGVDPKWSPKTSLCAVQMGGNPNCTTGGNAHIDMNLAPVIRQNGSMLAWTRWMIWICDDWSNASTCRNTGEAPEFNSKPYPTPWEGEDPSVWIDQDGHYHMVSHNGERGKDFQPHNTSGDCGRHYFSEFGLAGTWRVAPLLPPEDLGGCAFPRVDVPFDDGKTYTFYRRERPHLVLGPDGFTPVALTTAVIDSPALPGSQWGPGPNDVYDDKSYTLLQPVRH